MSLGSIIVSTLMFCVIQTIVFKFFVPEFYNELKQDVKAAVELMR